jgi:hypothetical protein
MSPASNNPSAPSENRYQKGVNDYRATLKWVISSFGAVAAALIVGLQLTSLGSLEGWRLIWALVSVSVAFGAVLIIIIASSKVLTPVIGTYHGFAHAPEFKALNDFLRDDPSPLQKRADSAGELAEKYEGADAAKLATWEAYQDDQDDEARQAAYEAALATYERLNGVVGTVTTLGLFLYMRQRFTRVMRLVYGGILIAGIGVIAFAYLANPSADAKTQEPAKKQKTVAQVQPVNCARYYLTLAELAYHEPNLSKHWLARSLDSQATACGLDNETAVTQFLTYLERSWRVSG